MDIKPYLDTINQIASGEIKLSKKQTVVTMTEDREDKFDNRLQEYINILNENNRTYTVQFSTTHDSRYVTQFSAMIIFDGDCCL